MAKFFLILGAIFSCTVRESIAFTPTPQFQLRRNNQHQRSTLSSLQMCICIHCARVTNCSAYHFVEQQHSQPHINKHPTWEPRNGSPTIQVHIRPDDTSKRELRKMWEEHEEETRRAEEAFAAENNGQDVDGTPLFGSTQYDLTGTTTYEYDVVECEDFVEERGAWVKNMPEEIKIANPHFVPT
ncbi:hypothetical protein HJC23_005213 [Cyclotella cryptica]|uniref:Uncharacterized protein n=1 Tax=Cyclotella cryptica TaxID=29204 RepID=A0ABD3P432_9STRA|eukprot:CCRYP_017804-RA/>CCRYP_017804-RA protein AED:0.31 eAED:0.31 QI:0/-1/0/1/-1/1/1/0/183